MRDKISMILIIQSIHLIEFHENNIFDIGQWFFPLPNLVGVASWNAVADKFKVGILNYEIIIHLWF